MKKYNFYIKNLGLFLSVELFIVLVISLLNLMGLSSSITSIMIFILNILLFISFGFIHGKKTTKKGYLVGLLTGIMLSLIMILLNLSFFKGDFNINLTLYYLILTISSTLGAMVGKSKKIEQ